MADYYTSPKLLNLDLLQVAVAQRVPKELLHGTKLSINETADHIGGMLVVQLEKYLLADRVLTDTAQVPYSRLTKVNVPNNWWRRLFRRPERVLDCVAEGEVTVKAEYFQTFPEPEFEYATSLGQPVKFMRMDPS